MGSVTHHASLTFIAYWDIHMGITTATVTITTATTSIHTVIVRQNDTHGTHTAEILLGLVHLVLNVP